MSTFQALNIEYDEDSDVEVDDTKEVQIEEALKLYQIALKSHAEGRLSFEATTKAYDDLFASEIFKYPESQDELQRVDAYGALDDENIWHERLGEIATASAPLDTGPSSLPQILHLSHKNYAQFRLETLSALLDNLSASLTHVLAAAAEALRHFVSAIDKDDSDLDLWKRTACVGELLDSKRIARFCLEAVLDGDAEGLGSVLSLPGIENGIAAQHLNSLVTGLNDHLSSIQQGLNTKRRKVLSRFLEERLDSCADLADKLQRLRASHKSERRPRQLSRRALKCPQSWMELGESLLQRRTDKQSIHTPYDSAIVFEPPSHESADEGIDGMQVEVVASEQDVADDQADNSAPQQSTRQSTDSPTEDRRPSTATNVENNDNQTVNLPSRKRPGDDTTEDGRARSKRLRARESIADFGDTRHALHDANVQWEFDQHLNELQSADDWLYETAGAVFNKLGITSFEGIRMVKSELEHHSPTQAITSGYRLAQVELSRFLNNYTNHAAQFLIASGDGLSIYEGAASDTDGAIGQPRQDFSSRHVQLIDQDLERFIRHANDTAQPLDAIVADFIDMMTYPGRMSLDGHEEASYITHQWSEQLKTTIVRALVQFDHIIYHRAFAALQVYRTRQPDETLGHEPEDTTMLRGLRIHLENVFELHLDIYCLIKRANSGVDRETIALQGDRVGRWFELNREANFALAQDSHHVEDVSLQARFLWSTTFYLAALDDVSQEHVLALMQDLRSRLSTDDTVLELINNAVMGEISTLALDREMSKLTTKDFFEKISDIEKSDPVMLIENIEPLLDLLDARSRGDTNHQDLAVSPELITFLENKKSSKILHLWTRLLDAYTQIEYTPMVVRTQLRMIRLILGQLKDSRLEHIPDSDRSSFLLSTMRTIDNLTAKVLKLMVANNDAVDCLDEENLKLSITAFGEILRLLQAFNVFEDPTRIGKSQPPAMTSGESFRSFCKTLHDMQLRIWVVLYFMLKEAMVQHADSFTTALEDRFEFLRALHRNLGIRAICGGLDKIFVKLCKDEFFTMTHVDGYDSEQAQVLYDLYGLNCFLNPSYELMDHHCEHYAFLDRTVALQTVDLLLAQANRLPIKDLVKHTLKDTIDKVHTAVTRKRPTEAILRNRDIIRALLKSSIRPLDLFQSLKGGGNQLAMSRVPESDASMAAKGWYFLMGHIFLTKFRTTKRLTSTATEDVDIAIAFFMQELEYSTTRWETWFRLAQAYDTKLEESVVWSSEKVNGSMPDVSHLQKAAIHCYTMATALAYRSAALAFETSDKMTELYSEFAMRMYSSTREPFSMLAFVNDESERFLSFRTGLAQINAFEPLQKYAAWKIAKVLFQRAIAGNPKQWMLHYMLGKCLWKMYGASQTVRRTGPRPAIQDVLNALYRAIDLLPGKKDTRDNKREPILEPHYKLVSIVHKLVMLDQMTLPQAQEALSQTHYVKAADFPNDREGWLPFILAVLRSLRAADKSNWHHRMVVRTAQITFDDAREPDQLVRAADSKQELTQQVFTKTMVLQVWRPEAERAGRHFVYTARYIRFLVRILEILKDRTSLEMLARRVRRRPHEIFEHSLVWQDIMNAYLRLLRERGQLNEGLENSTFNNLTHEEFLARKEPLEKWMQTQDDDSNTVLDVLREVQELKKLNANLMKLGPIDDLIGDAYAQLYSTIGKQLWDEHQQAEQEKPKFPSPVLENAVSNPMHIASILSLDGASGSSTVKPDMPEPEAAPTKRRLGIGRREIRSAAEACLHKAAALKSRPTILLEDGKQIAEISARISAPASVEDDADDESELSELEEAGSDGDKRVGDGETVDDGTNSNKGGVAVSGDTTMADADADALEGVRQHLHEPVLSTEDVPQ